MNTSPRKAILTMILVGIGIGSGLAACSGESQQEIFEDQVMKRGTPSGATNIQFIDGRWYTFEYKDQCFLAMKYWRHASLTKIDCED